MLEEELKIKLTHEIIDPIEFDEIVIDAYNNGNADESLAAYHFFARSGVPAGTAEKRSVLNFSDQFPEFIAKKCTGCMDCVNLCPDNAIKVKVIPESEIEDLIDIYADEEEYKQLYQNQFTVTEKFYNTAKKKSIEGGKFILAVDPDKCKGCAQCVKVCDESALTLIKKESGNLNNLQGIYSFFKKLPETETCYINEKEPRDIMLKQSSLLYTGGTGSCKGCGEASAIRMMLAVTNAKYGKVNIGILNESGCPLEYSIEYPYNPFLIPVVNNSPGNIFDMAVGIRAKWNHSGWKNKKLWIISRNSGFSEKGFKSLSFLLKSGLDINILSLDRNGYNNKSGKVCSLFPNAFSAQTAASDIEHFYSSIISANEFEGPAIINVYAACQPEHGIADDMSQEQSQLAINSRAFPMFIYDPRMGKRIKERLSLQGNPAVIENWYRDPESEEIIDFIYYSKTENRFSKFLESGKSPKPELLKIQEDRLYNWNELQKLAGIR
jgi:pyruvate/2-oxoacid:ferredoxin oxidoreductase beta subunit/NAD-dependent dihydropyrimidine dehydrogenase PreA subunit